VTQNDSQKYAFFEGQIVPFEEAKVSVMTHAFNYGTGVFEGMRGYWNEEKQEIYLVLIREHYRRFLRNTKMVFIDVPYTAEQLTDITVELIRKHDYAEDVYIRPLAYKSSETIGVSMEGVEDGLAILAVPFGNYVPMDRGLSVCVSSWKRTDDNAIPARAKVTGNYINSALAKNEAVLNGYDEALVLNNQGLVSEASAANVFILRDGVLVTPGFADTILEGLTRDMIIKLAKDELGVPTVERQIARSELYYAEEMFLCGTGVQLAGVTSVDKRTIGSGQVGPITSQLQHLYMDVVKGRVPKYLDWLTPVNEPARVDIPAIAASAS
jgi:branched-chain amino acid aminotransferase